MEPLKLCTWNYAAKTSILILFDGLIKPGLLLPRFHHPANDKKGFRIVISTNESSKHKTLERG